MTAATAVTTAAAAAVTVTVTVAVAVTVTEEATFAEDRTARGHGLAPFETASKVTSYNF